MNNKGQLERDLRTAIRRRGMAIRTEASYVSWYRRFVKFHRMRHPMEVGQDGVEAFLNHLAINRDVAPGTQNQAFSALLFLYREVLKQEWTKLSAKRAKERQKLPVILSQEEMRAVLQKIPAGTPKVLISLLYGCGLRVTEALRLRIKDVDFPNQLIWVRDGKGGKDRSLTMPEGLRDALERQRCRARTQFEEDEATGGARVYVEPSLDRKSSGTFSKSWEWFWIFPAGKKSKDPRDGVLKRHHLLEGAVSKWLKKALKEVGVEKRVTAHTLRHSYATHLCIEGTDLKSLQEAMGHGSLKTTEVYLQLVRSLKGAPKSPLDTL